MHEYKHVYLQIKQEKRRFHVSHKNSHQIPRNSQNSHHECQATQIKTCHELLIRINIAFITSVLLQDTIPMYPARKTLYSTASVLEGVKELQSSECWHIQTNKQDPLHSPIHSCESSPSRTQLVNISISFFFSFTSLWINTIFSFAE